MGMLESNLYQRELTSKGLKLSINLSDFQGESPCHVDIADILDGIQKWLYLGVLEPYNSSELDCTAYRQ